MIFLKTSTRPFFMFLRFRVDFWCHWGQNVIFNCWYNTFYFILWSINLAALVIYKSPVEFFLNCILEINTIKCQTFKSKASLSLHRVRTVKVVPIKNSDTFKLRPFKFLLAYHSVVWAPGMKNSGTLMHAARNLNSLKPRSCKFLAPVFRSFF